jgi:hypothetical protein
VNLERISVVDVDGKEHVLHVDHLPNVPHIGQGTRARVSEVLVAEEEAGDEAGGHAMVVKTFENRERVQDAMRGYQALKQNLPPEELSHLIPEFYADPEGNRVYMTKLNDDKFVVSMGQNESVDRTALQQEKLKDIPNFSAFMNTFLDGAEASAERAFHVGADVYFFTIDRTKRSMDYVYADTETAGEKRLFSEEATPLVNLYNAGGALNHFLHECVEHPEQYLERLRLEVQSRMTSYADIDSSAMEDSRKFGAEFSWPELSTWQSMKVKAPWILNKILRFVKGSFAS